MADRPNILIIWGDDIGISNLSCYSDGLMGYRTPNIDRIAAEGVRFTDYYGEQSCTAGRAAFITGQNPYRTGLTKVGMPGADIGLRAEDPTIATALKSLGLRDRAVRQEPLRRPRRVPPDRARVRRVLRQPLPPQRRGGAGAARLPDRGGVPRTSARASDRAASSTPGRTSDGTQRIEDTGPLTKERMKTIDDEVVPEALRFMTDAKESDTPFFVWLNTTHMHFRTHVKDGSRGKAGRWQSEYHDTMCDHDELVGSVLDYLDEQRPGRQHDRHVLDRQRSAHEQLAGRRHDAVPQREELQLGGRLPRAGDGALARAGSSPARCSTGSSATTTGS